MDDYDAHEQGPLRCRAPLSTPKRRACRDFDNGGRFLSDSGQHGGRAVGFDHGEEMPLPQAIVSRLGGQKGDSLVVTTDESGELKKMSARCTPGRLSEEGSNNP